MKKSIKDQIKNCWMGILFIIAIVVMVINFLCWCGYNIYENTICNHGVIHDIWALTAMFPAFIVIICICIIAFIFIGRLK